MKVECLEFKLQLKDPFTISRGTVTEQPTMVLRVERDGLVGYGEATTNTYYGITLEAMQAAVAAVEKELAVCELDNPAELWKQFDPILKDCRFAQCALDCAIWDLYAKQQDLPLWKLWGFSHDDPMPPSCFTIGLDTPQVMLKKLAENPGWPVYKIKLDATGNLDIIRDLRASTDARFRVDANCAWQQEQVQAFASELSTMDVELIEQPLAADEYEKMKSLKGQCALPLMADESCQVEADVDRCLDAFDAINVKLVKCGGLTPARRMITRAKQRGLKVMVGCMTESSIGIAPGVHLLPLLDFADLDGALLLAKDIAQGLQWENGYCQLPERPGLGVELI